jgi:integral membrane protein
MRNDQLGWRQRLIARFESFRPFSESEAWGLFRFAALGEAFGWTVLIAAIIIRHYRFPGYGFAIPVGGQIHGTLFVVYFGLLVGISSSLRWSWKRLFLGAVVGVIPFGTLVFEQWIARGRTAKVRQEFVYNTLLSMINIGA